MDVIGAKPARILFATSGSAAAYHATVVAAELASAFAAELTIVHVVAPIEHRVGRFAPTLPITRRLDDPHASAVLLNARRIAWENGAPSRTVLVAGDPPRALVAIAARIEADLLVIAGKRRGRLGALRATHGRWIGTYAPCPVLAVPPRPAASLDQNPEASEPLAVLSCDGQVCTCFEALENNVLTADRSA
jgi:nucleotide-binding universal stress UspA family protein